MRRILLTAVVVGASFMGVAAVAWLQAELPRAAMAADKGQLPSAYLADEVVAPAAVPRFQLAQAEHPVQQVDFTFEAPQPTAPTTSDRFSSAPAARFEAGASWAAGAVPAAQARDVTQGMAFAIHVHRGGPGVAPAMHLTQRVLAGKPEQFMEVAPPSSTPALRIYAAS